MEGFNLTQFAAAKHLVAEISRIDQHYYPENLGVLFVINAPLLFRSAWVVVKQFLDDRTIGKIKVLGASYREDLLALIPAENLPTRFGGLSRANEMEDLGPWARASSSTISQPASRRTSQVGRASQGGGCGPVRAPLPGGPRSIAGEELLAAVAAAAVAAGADGAAHPPPAAAAALAPHSRSGSLGGSGRAGGRRSSCAEGAPAAAGLGLLLEDGCGGDDGTPQLQEEGGGVANVDGAAASSSKPARSLSATAASFAEWAAARSRSMAGALPNGSRAGSGAGADGLTARTFAAKLVLDDVPRLTPEVSVGLGDRFYTVSNSTGDI